MAVIDYAKLATALEIKVDPATRRYFFYNVGTDEIQELPDHVVKEVAKKLREVATKVILPV